MIDGWDAIRDPARVAGPVLVADWGGGWTGLDAAETAGRRPALRVWLAVAAPIVGETVHQYQRVFYLARLERLGVTILHHRELVDAPGGALLRSLWTHAPEPLPDGVRTLVLALGREPVDGLVHELAERGDRLHRRRRLPRRALARGGDPRGHRRRRAAAGRRSFRPSSQDALSGSPERSSVACASSRISSVMSRLAL